jgi:hypothetical protein
MKMKARKKEKEKNTACRNLDWKVEQEKERKLVIEV